eukprot:SAG31_NODE_457_length_15415_cov_4.380387_9_plen_60_part_00
MDQGAPKGGHTGYNFVNGRIYYLGAINVSWQLKDVTETDGGFIVCPGSVRKVFSHDDCG